MLYPFWKRLIDVSLALAGLALLSPILVTVGIAVKSDSTGPALFRHERVGRFGRSFRLLKFRSMTHGSLGREVTVSGDARVTSVGRFLRRTKLDELPQLWNVLVGDMSLVGPRPEVARYVELFECDYRDILEVRPGITDFAAIEYRDEERILATSPDPEAAYCQTILPAKIALYQRYLRERSLSTDFAILARTFLAILR